MTATQRTASCNGRAPTVLNRVHNEGQRQGQGVFSVVGGGEGRCCMCIKL